MRIITEKDTLSPDVKTVVTVGNFDGLHLGHTRLIARAAGLARSRGYASAAVTFEPHTRSVLYPELSTKQLTTFEEKAVLMEKLGLDYVFRVNFDENFRRMSQEEFVEKVLFGRLGACEWVMGEGHLVGHDRAGGKKNLHFVAGKYHIKVLTEPLEVAGEAVISSTRIRGLVSEGRITDAAAMLGRPYFVLAERTQGVKVGTKIGFPTLNFKGPGSGKVIPPAGVYAAEIEIAENGINTKTKKIPGALYFGDCPTYRGRETHFEFHALTYGKDTREPAMGEFVHLWLYKYIRPDNAFPNEEALKAQIAADVNQINKYFLEERL
jgi:riboflavin kinase/FMN adenylyltransferase